MTLNHRLVSYLGLLCLLVKAPYSCASEPLRLFGELVPLDAAVGFAATEDSVDVHGHLAVVGAGYFYAGAALGAAYVFDISDPRNPTQIARLTASDNHAGNEYGASVAVWGDQVYVSASGANGNTGAIYRYDLSDRSNITEQKITAFDAAREAYFGYDIAVDGNRLIAGSPFFSIYSPPASAYVLDVSDPENISQTKLLRTPGSRGGNFAEQVDISGDFAIVGHISESTQFPFSGSAHLYDLSNPQAIRQQQLFADDTDHHAFGETVAIDGKLALVSVSSDPGPAHLSGASDGAIWAIDFSDWNNPVQYEFGRLPAGRFSAPFGRGLSLKGGVALAGAFNEDFENGAVYAYDVSDYANPRELDRLTVPGAAGERFGRTLAFDGTSAVIGSGGRVFLFSTVPEPTSSALLAFALLRGLSNVSRRR